MPLQARFEHVYFLRLPFWPHPLPVETCVFVLHFGHFGLLDGAGPGWGSMPCSISKSAVGLNLALSLSPSLILNSLRRPSFLRCFLCRRISRSILRTIALSDRNRPADLFFSLSLLLVF